MLPCPTVVLPGKNEFKIFQHYMYFSSDRAAAGLKSDFQIALVTYGNVCHLAHWFYHIWTRPPSWLIKPTLKANYLLQRKRFFSLRVDPFSEGKQNTYDIVSSPENITIPIE